MNKPHRPNLAKSFLVPFQLYFGKFIYALRYIICTNVHSQQVSVNQPIHRVTYFYIQMFISQSDSHIGNLLLYDLTKSN